MPGTVSGTTAAECKFRSLFLTDSYHKGGSHEKFPETRRSVHPVRQMLDGLDEKPTVFEQEYFPEMALAVSDEPYTVTYDELEQEYVVEGPRIEKMLGYTNLESEKGFAFFQGFLKDAGILDKLEELGIQEGDTVRMYGLSFDYYK